MLPWYVNPDVLFSLSMHVLLVFFLPWYFFSRFASGGLGGLYNMTEEHFVLLFDTAADVEVYCKYILVFWLVPTIMGLIATFHHLIS